MDSPRAAVMKLAWRNGRRARSIAPRTIFLNSRFAAFGFLDRWRRQRARASLRRAACPSRRRPDSNPIVQI